MGLGQLNLRKLNALALFGARFGSDGKMSYVCLFIDKMDFIFFLLVNIGKGISGKSVISLKSLYIKLHLLARISCILG